MDIRATTREAVRSVWGVKQRSLLVLLGITIGIGAFIAMVSLGEAVKAESLRQIQAAGVDIITASFDPPPGSRGRRELSLKDADALRREGSLLHEVSAEAATSGPAKYLNQNWTATIKGVTPTYLGVLELRPEAGRFLVALDDQKRVAVLGSQVAQKLRGFGLVQPLGYALTLHGQKYQIVGILAPKSQKDRPSPADDSIFVPLATLQRTMPGTRLGTLIVKAKKDVNPRNAASQVQDILSVRLGNVPGLGVTSQELLIRQLEEQMRLYTLLLGLIGSISLVVGGVGIMNMMLLAVTEKRKEIGIRRALGARQLDIQLQFLCESSLLSLAGGVIGILAGFAGARIVSQYVGLQPLFSASALGLGLLTAVVVGVFFGFYPARKASRLDPVMALRGE